MGSMLDYIARPAVPDVGRYYDAQQQSLNRKLTQVNIDAGILKNESAQELLDILRDVKPSRVEKEVALNKYTVEKAKRDERFEQKAEVTNALVDVVSAEEYANRIETMRQQLAPGLSREAFEEGYLKPHGLSLEYNPQELVALEDSFVRDMDMKKKEHGMLFKHKLDMEAARVKGMYDVLKASKDYKPKTDLGKLFADLDHNIEQGNTARAQLLISQIERNIQRDAAETRGKEQDEITDTLRGFFPSVASWDPKTMTTVVDGDTVLFDMESYRQMADYMEDLMEKMPIDQAARQTRINWTQEYLGNWDPTTTNRLIFRRAREEERLAAMNLLNMGSPEDSPNIKAMSESEISEAAQLASDLDFESNPALEHHQTAYK